MVNHCINDKFKMFLDLTFISDCNHSFYDEKIKTKLLERHYGKLFKWCTSIF